MRNSMTVEVRSNNNSWEMAYQKWLPDTEPVAVFLVVHGLAEHSGRYAYVANFLNTHGYAVYAMDHIGHGNSSGVRGHLQKFSQFTDGVAALEGIIQNNHQKLPVFILGHSLGGLITTNYLLQNQTQFAGCILSGPAIITTEQPSRLLLLINKVLATVAPKTGMLQIDGNGISRDPDVVQDYIDDPLVFNGKISSRFIAEMFSAMTNVRNKAAEISIPLLIMHGEDDKLTSTEGSKELYKRAASKDKTLRLYPDLYHEIFNEPEKDTILDELQEWILKHLP